MSGYLHDSLELGDIIEAGVPCGDFVLVPGSSCVFLGAGIGITPLLSMMKVSAANGAKVPSIIIFSIKCENKIALFSEYVDISGLQF